MSRSGWSFGCLVLKFQNFVFCNNSIIIVKIVYRIVIELNDKHVESNWGLLHGMQVSRRELSGAAGGSPEEEEIHRLFFSIQKLYFIIVVVAFAREEETNDFHTTSMLNMMPIKLTTAWHSCRCP